MIEFKMPEGGLAVWSSFDKGIDLLKMSGKAAKNGLYIDNGEYYKNESFSSNAMRMGFASLDEKEIVEALGILHKTIR